MILITPAQCRAARALLNWSQPDLAQRCGMHVQTISAFENETGSPTKTTLQKIAKNFEQAGIEFLPHNGTCLSEKKFYGLDAYTEVLQDCLNDLSSNDEILFHCGDDRRSSEAVENKLQELADNGIKMRMTTCKGNNKLRPFREYRLVPEDYFKSAQLTMIYGDKFCLNVDEVKEGYRFLIIKNKTLANVMRRQFEYWWKNGKEIPKA